MFFYIVQSFGNKLKLHDLWVVEDDIQDLNTVNCGVFQMYFYHNLFNHDKNSKIQNKTKLNKKNIEILLNELFVLDDQQQNQKMINECADEPAIIYLSDTVNFGQVKSNDIKKPPTLHTQNNKRAMNERSFVN